MEIYGYESVIGKNPNRKLIMDILKQSKKDMNISDIHKAMQKKVKISYKSVYKNIKILEEIGLISLKKNPSASGQAITIRIRKIKSFRCAIVCIDNITNKVVSEYTITKYLFIFFKNFMNKENYSDIIKKIQDFKYKK